MKLTKYIILILACGVVVDCKIFKKLIKKGSKSVGKKILGGLAAAVVVPIVGGVVDGILGGDDSGNYSGEKDPPTCSHWSRWGECSVTCGQGHQTRVRTCPESSLAQREETRPCALLACPQPCKETFKSEVSKSGSFRSPRHTTTSAVETCEYLFEPRFDELVIIEFTDFQLTNWASSRVSVLEKVYNNSDFLPTMIYTGGDLPQPFVTARVMKMVYRTEARNARNDVLFRANFKFIKKDADEGIECSSVGECWFVKKPAEESNVGVALGGSLSVGFVVCVFLVVFFTLRKRSTNKRPLGRLPPKKAVPVLTFPINRDLQEMSSKSSDQLLDSPIYCNAHEHPV